MTDVQERQLPNMSITELRAANEKWLSPRAGLMACVPALLSGQERTA